MLYLHYHQCQFVDTMKKFRHYVRQTYNDIFQDPSQIRGKYYTAVKVCGRIGFFTKGFIYGTIGGLTIASALTAQVNNESPQGVFILMGSFPSASGHILLILMMSGVSIYALWRFWEGLTGQGYDDRFSRKKNFFRYRLSPLASGIVYVAYDIYIIYLFTLRPAAVGSTIQEESTTCFPVCWRDSIIGKIGLGLLAVAFTIATVTQLIPAFTGNFRNEMDFNKFRGTVGRMVKYPFLISGHIGFLSRAVLFFFVCFLFWKILLSEGVFVDPKQSTVAQAINIIREYLWGKIIMTVLGIGLIIYGIFAILCMYFKIFPTPPPSMNRSLHRQRNMNNTTRQTMHAQTTNSNAVQPTTQEDMV